MNKKFKFFKIPTEQEIKYLWENCIFVFDTNILLDLYRFSETTRKDFLKILKYISDRIWIPYQVGFEFYNNRIDVIKGEIDKYDKFIDNIKTTLNKSENEIVSKKSHPYLDLKLINNISNMIEEENENINNEKNKLKDLLNNDLIESELDKLFEDKIGEKFSDEDLKKILIEGEYRFNNKIPPGYEDFKDKSGIRKYGDLIIWFEIIKMSKMKQKPILFIIEDSKKDWWKNYKVKNFSTPRPELIQEFNSKSLQEFYMYKIADFMSQSQHYLNQEIDPQSIEEVKVTKTNEEMDIRKFITLIKNNDLNNYKNLILINNLLSEANSNEMYIKNSKIYEDLLKLFDKKSKDNDAENTENEDPID